MKGQCLCGAVTITTAGEQTLDACHCGTCRRWGGGPFMTVHGSDDIRIDGGGKLKAYRSSEWAERAFCAECGTHLFYHLLPANKYFLSAWLFEEASGMEFKRQIFIDRKPGNYAFANDNETLTEAQVFGKA